MVNNNRNNPNSNAPPKDDTEADATFSDFSEDDEDTLNTEEQMIRDEHKGKAEDGERDDDQKHTGGDLKGKKRASTTTTGGAKVVGDVDSLPAYEPPVQLQLPKLKLPEIVGTPTTAAAASPPRYDLSARLSDSRAPPPAFDSPKVKPTATTLAATTTTVSQSPSSIAPVAAVNFNQLVALQYKGPKTTEKIPPRILDYDLGNHQVLRPIYRNCIIMPVGSEERDCTDCNRLLNYIGEGSHQVEADEDVPPHHRKCAYVDKSIMDRFDNLASFMTVWLRPSKDTDGVVPEESNMRDRLIAECDCVLYMFDLVRTEEMLAVDRTTGQQLIERHQKVLEVNPSIIPILVGTNYEQFSLMGADTQSRFVRRARTMARQLSTALIFISTSDGTNIEPLFELSFALSRNKRSFTYVLTTPKTREALLEYHYLMAIQDVKNKKFRESVQERKRRVTMADGYDEDDEDDDEEEDDNDVGTEEEAEKREKANGNDAVEQQQPQQPTVVDEPLDVMKLEPEAQEQD